MPQQQATLAPDDLQTPERPKSKHTFGLCAAILLLGPLILGVMTGEILGSMILSIIFGVPILLGMRAQMNKGRTGVWWTVLSFVVMLIAYLTTAAAYKGEITYGLSGALLFGALPMFIVVQTLPSRM